MLNKSQLPNQRKKPATNNIESFLNFDNFYAEETPLITSEERNKKNQPKKLEFNLFNYQKYYETELIKKQIKELTEVIKQEIELIKKNSRELMSEIKDISNLTLNQPYEKPGIYHVRFLEIILNFLRQIKAKVGESKTWLQVFLSKKKKRGSLFAVRSKKLGTQYSLSQELQASRSVQ